MQPESRSLLTKKIVMDKRQMRITWNKNNWEKPSGHPWIKENQGNKNIPYENQYGFGHEEWLFNYRYRLDGFQYGYIRGVEKARLNNKNTIDELYLYTKDPSNNHFLVGILNNVIRLKNKEKEYIKKQLFEKHHDTARDELSEVNGDIREFLRIGVNPTLKFVWEEANIFEEPILIKIDETKYRRYQPYKLTHELKQYVKKASLAESHLSFKPGKSKNKKSYTQSKSKGEREITKLHVEILDNLYLHLIRHSDKNNLSQEKSIINNKIIDLLEYVEKNKYNFYEVKTSNSGLTNLRDALGQIFEYALMDQNVIPNKLIIVGPSKLNLIEKSYLARLQQFVSIHLEYWYYHTEKKVFEKNQ